MKDYLGNASKLLTNDTLGHGDVWQDTIRARSSRINPVPDPLFNPARVDPYRPDGSCHILVHVKRDLGAIYCGAGCLRPLH